MKTFAGPVLFLDRSDINTDEIIAANLLAELPKQELTSHLFENLKIEGFNPKSDIAGKKVIITKENFGCGSESEHAPWALEVNGINTEYSNINASNYKLYDYVEKGKLLGEVDGNKLYLSFEKEGKYLDYKKYI